MTDKAMSPEQSRALEDANDRLKSAEGRLELACHVAVQSLKYAYDGTVAHEDATDFHKVCAALRELIRWTAEYQKERAKHRGLEEVGRKWFDAWNAAESCVTVVRPAGEDEHGSYQSVHHALKGMVEKVMTYVAVTADRGEGGIDPRWKGE